MHINPLCLFLLFNKFRINYIFVHNKFLNFNLIKIFFCQFSIFKTFRNLVIKYFVSEVIFSTLFKYFWENKWIILKNVFFLSSFDNAFQISANVHEYSKTLSSALVSQATLLVFYLSASTTLHQNNYITG